MSRVGLGVAIRPPSLRCHPDARTDLHFGPIRPPPPQCRRRLSNLKFQILNCFVSRRSKLQAQESLNELRGIGGRSAGSKARKNQSRGRIQFQTPARRECAHRRAAPGKRLSHPPEPGVFREDCREKCLRLRPNTEPSGRSSDTSSSELGRVRTAGRPAVSIQL